MAKCVECGFLSLRNVETRALDEAEETFRKDGKTVSVERSYPQEIGMARFITEEAISRYVHEKLPICFAGSCDLRALISELVADKECDIYEGIKTITHENRECDLFAEWRQGSTPKEHQEMIDRQAMLKYQAEREDADRKWQTKQLWFMAIVAGIFTIIGGVIGAVIAILLSGNHP
jgi:hypothetical protein